MNPTGNVTFLFTDIEGSTKLAQKHHDKLQEALEKHHSIINEAVGSNNGIVFKLIGDAFCCAFHNAQDAINAAVESQIKLNSEEWNGAQIKVRMGIHSGNAEWHETDYMGYITLARSARVMSAANGGQILISNTVYEQLSKHIYEVDGEISKINIDKSSLQISFRNLGERRLKDLIQPMNLYQLISDNLPSDFPPLKTLDARPNNLPIQLTSFIGREDVMKQLRNLFVKTRLLTITGTGGAGKTRLAMQTGADMIDEFENGIFLVELAPVTDPAFIAFTVLNSIGIKEESEKSPEESLITFLKNKKMLLILDNCEHLISHCAVLAESLLKNCPDLKIIATSREALNCQGEQTFRLPSLSLPDVNADNTPEQLTQYEAVRLFIERALSVNPGFRVNNDNAPALVQICSQLDGIPLAIELAAARIRVLTPEKICEKLDDRFRLLTGGKRTALPRQQTLKALIDWSYDLLNENEKILFQRLSVFSGGWTLEAAEEICSDENFDFYETMDTHSHLLDKSLINKTETSGSIRFYFLESIRQYANEILDPEDNVHNAHFNYFMKISDQSIMLNDSMDQKQWTKLIDTETGNLRSAINRALENNPENACIIVNNMVNYWDIKAYFLEGLLTCKKVQNLNLENVSEINKAKIIYSLGLMYNNVGNIPEAEKFIKDALNIFRKIEDKLGISECLNSLGVIISISPSRMKESKEYYVEALSIVKDLNLKRNTANLLYNMSFMAIAENDMELALEYRLESLAIYRELKDFSQLSRTLASLSVFEQRRYNFEKALFYNEESLAIATELDDKYLISINLSTLGNIYFGKEDFDNACKMYNESLTILREYEYKSNLIAVLQLLGQAYEKIGEFEKAISQHKESVLLGRENGNEYFLATNFCGLGTAFFGLKEYETSLKYFSFLKTMTDGKYDPISIKLLNLAEELRIKIKEIIGSEKYSSVENDALKLTKDESVNFTLNN